MIQQLPALLNIGTFQPDHHGNIYAHFTDGLNNPLGNFITAHDATKNIHQDGLHLIAGKDELECFTDSLSIRAPTHIQKRNEDWGPGGVETRFADAWTRFTALVGNWITVRTVTGRDGVEQTYGEMLNGQVTPDIGYVLSIRET